MRLWPWVAVLQVQQFDPQTQGFLAVCPFLAARFCCFSCRSGGLVSEAQIPLVASHEHDDDSTIPMTKRTFKRKGHGDFPMSFPLESPSSAKKGFLTFGRRPWDDTFGLQLASSSRMTDNRRTFRDRHHRSAFFSMTDHSQTFRDRHNRSGEIQD